MSETPERVHETMARALAAAASFNQFDQARTDLAVRAAYEAAFAARVQLAKTAHEETGIGIWQHKVFFNVVASQFVYEDIRDLKTVGIISDDLRAGITEIAQPLGPILAIIPVTNPTSTTIFKILIALKTRNPLILSPTRPAVKCVAETARICYEAALKAGAPEHCVQWASDWTEAEVGQLLSHPDLALVLATGGGATAKAAYNCGKPALGVGMGNAVYIEKSADVPHAVQSVLASKTFDNGAVTASEQAIIVEQAVAATVRTEFQASQAHFLSRAEVAKVQGIAFDPATGQVNPAIVGRSVAVIAELAGISVPAGSRLLIAPLAGVGEDYPLCAYVPAPLIAWFEAENLDAAVRICLELNRYCGVGHTATLHCNDEARILEFSRRMKAGRIVVNTPALQGMLGGLYNTLHPSFTVGCPMNSNTIAPDNITARHLINIQRLVRRRSNERLDRFNVRLLYDEKLDAAAIAQRFNQNY